MDSKIWVAMQLIYEEMGWVVKWAEYIWEFADMRDVEIAKH
jgi:hypothetical protein